MATKETVHTKYGQKLKISELAEIKPHHTKIGAENAGILILCSSESGWAKGYTCKKAWEAAGKPKKAVFFAVWAAITCSSYGHMILNEKYFPRFTDNIDDLVEVIGHIGNID